VGSKRLDSVLRTKCQQDVFGATQWIVELGEPLDQSGASLEELAELLDAQLPR